MSANASAEDVLAGADPAVRKLATRTRDLVRRALPGDVVETVDGTDIGYGWTAGYKGLICVVGIHSRWVNLGLVDGATLPDPGGLLRGTGKRHRFVRIEAAADLDRLDLLDLLRAAVDAHPRPEG